MRKVLKSDAIAVSEDIYRIKEAAPKTPPAAVSQPEGTEPVPPVETEEVPDSNAVAEMIIQKAVEQADRIMADAAQRAQAERAEILHRAQEEAALAKEQARQDGEREGAQSQVEEIRACIAQLELAISKLEGEQAGFVAEYEQNLKWMALEIASKVLNKRLDYSDADIADLVRGAVNTVKGANWITVQISDGAPKLLETLIQSLKIAEGGKITIHDIPAPPGTCIVETPESVVDASVYIQLENLKEYFLNE